MEIKFRKRFLPYNRLKKEEKKMKDTQRLVLGTLYESNKGWYFRDGKTISSAFKLMPSELCAICCSSIGRRILNYNPEIFTINISTKRNDGIIVEYSDLAITKYVIVKRRFDRYKIFDVLTRIHKVFLN